jgi:hypothetical protein
VSRRALFREVNAKICEIDATFGTSGSVYHVLCECGLIDCYSRFEVPASLYDDVRADGRRFVVATGHHRDEAIVSSGLRFDVVDTSVRPMRTLALPEPA